MTALTFRDVSKFSSVNTANFFLSPFHGLWQDFITIEVCIDCIPAFVPSCKKQLNNK